MDAGRLGWLIASTVVVATLQRAVDQTGTSLFLLKGGTYLQHRMSSAGRPTKDVDGLVRGDLDAFLDVLDEALRLPWGTLTLTRSDPEVIATPARVVQPRREVSMPPRYARLHEPCENAVKWGQAASARGTSIRISTPRPAVQVSRRATSYLGDLTFLFAR